MFTVNEKVSNLWQDLFKSDTALYQAFLSLNVDIEITKDCVKIYPELRKVS